MPVFDKLKSLYKRLPWMFKVGPIPGIHKSKCGDELRAIGVPFKTEHEMIFLRFEEKLQKIDAKLEKLKRKEHNQQDLFKDLDGAPKLSDDDRLYIEYLEKEKTRICDLMTVLVKDLVNSVNETL